MIQSWEPKHTKNLTKKKRFFSQKLHSSTQTSSRYAENFYFLKKTQKKTLNLQYFFFLLLCAELCVMCVLSWSNFFLLAVYPYLFTFYKRVCTWYIHNAMLSFSKNVKTTNSRIIETSFVLLVLIYLFYLFFVIVIIIFCVADISFLLLLFNNFF